MKLLPRLIIRRELAKYSAPNHRRPATREGALSSSLGASGSPFAPDTPTAFYRRREQIYIARYTAVREICAFSIPRRGYGEIICPWQSNTAEFCGWCRSHKACPVPTANYEHFDGLRPIRLGDALAREIAQREAQKRTSGGVKVRFAHSVLYRRYGLLSARGTIIHRRDDDLFAAAWPIAAATSP